MRVTIIPSDNTVYVDGEALTVDCSNVDKKIHAVQWNGEVGWVEYVKDGFSPPRGNDPITSIDDFKSVVDAWQAEKAKLIAAASATTK